MDGNTVDDIRNRQLLRYGHVKRKEEERLAKQLLEWQAEGRRRRGRPRMTWEEEIAKAVSERNLHEGDWRERERWRALGRGKCRRTLQKQMMMMKWTFKEKHPDKYLTNCRGNPFEKLILQSANRELPHFIEIKSS
jgi:hypothetical protein